MFKKIIIYSVLCLLLVATTDISLAQSTYDETGYVQVKDHSGTLSLGQIEKLENCVSANIGNEDGTVTPLDVIVEVDEVTPINTRFSLEEGKTYIMTVSASSDKTITDSGSVNWSEGVKATANLKMVWTDVKGTKNIIKTVTGTMTLTKGHIQNSKLHWGDDPQRLKDVNSVSGAVTKLTYSPNFESQSLFGTVTARYQTWFTETGNLRPLTVTVTPTIFD